MQEESIFLTAVRIESPGERALFLDDACKNDARLREGVETLLRHHNDAGSFLETPPEALGTLGVGDFDTVEEPIDPTSLDLEPSQKPGCLGTVGPYDVAEVIGRGGMGVVLKGLDPKLNRVVALKVLAPELASHVSARNRFLREGQAAAAIHHDHVVTIYAIDDTGSLPFIAMEYVSGKSLQQKLDEIGALELTEILGIGKQAAAGLAAAHEQRLIHRDIKPANLLIEKDVERVKITDFGLARAVDDVRITKPGVVTGTPEYMSPEQARSEPVDHRSDLFSLGCVLYAMCTGQSPFCAENTVAMIRRVCDDEPRSIQEANPEIPDWLTKLIEKLLAKDPDERFQSAREVAELLDKYLAHVQEPTLNTLAPEFEALPERPNSEPLAWRRNRATVASMVLLLLVGLGLTEVTGITAITPTIIRIVRGDGTLLIEVDDPEIEVLIDGQDVVLTGAGPKEIRLRPGQHELKATNDGQTIQTELINITRGAKRVVRISLAGKKSKTKTVHQSSGGAVLRQVWAGEDVDLRGSITTDGRYLSFVDLRTWDLALRDLITGTNRLLTRNAPQSYGEANQSIFSPDNQQIAYTWLNEQWQYELRVGRVDETQHRLLYRDDSSYARPIDWSPDGSRILVIFDDVDVARMGWLSTFDGTVQFLKSLDWDHPVTTPRPVSLSPDGRYVAYHRTPSSDSINRDIFLLNADGTSELALVQHRADDRVLGWTPDGSGLLFSSDRRGTVDAWFLRVTGGRPQGAPQLVKTNLGNIEPLGFAHDGSFYFGVRTGGFDVYIGTFAGQADAMPTPQRAAAYFEGSNSRPRWSRDGRFLAFVSKRRLGHVLCILSLETGQQREFPLLSKVPYRSSGVCWSPEGKYILVEQRGKSGQGIYRVDTTSGEISALLASGPDERLYQPQLAPDGKTLFFLRANDDAHRIVRHVLTTGEETDLHRSSPFINSLALARDGQTLAFILGDGTATGLLNVIPAHNGDATTLLELNPGDAGNGLAWTPDGGHLLVKRGGDEPGKSELWRVSIKGGNAERLSVAMARIFSLSMHPDGQRVAFHGGELPQGEVWVMENLQIKDSSQ